MDRKIEIVEWIDPYSDDEEWTAINKIKIDLPTVYSVGFVVKETKEVLVIAHSFGRIPKEKSEQECCGMMIIPKKAIKRRRKLNGLLRQKKRK